MNKNLIYGLLILISVGIFLFYNYSSKKINVKTFINDIREENKYGFDSLQKAMNNENSLHFRIRESIENRDFEVAHSLMDSLPTFGKNNTVHIYKGMIYAKQKKYSKAIEEYNAALRELDVSIALAKRAEVYVEMNKMDSAMLDYKKVYSWNYDYSLQIASTFERMKKKDSARKYYQIYLEHYPNEDSVRQKLDNDIK